jgi:hypothetical protein
LSLRNKHSRTWETRALGEFFDARAPGKSDTADPLETALFLESEFGVTVPEADLEEGRLDSREGAAALLTELMHVDR